MQRHVSSPYRYRLEIKRFGERDQRRFLPAQPNVLQVRRDSEPLASSDGYVRLASAVLQASDSVRKWE